MNQERPPSILPDELYRLESYHFDLPPELIAQYPAPERSASRLLVLHSSSGRLEDRRFPAIMDYLQAGDSLVLNKTRVMPARFSGVKDSGGQVELFLLQPEDEPALVWQALVRPAKRLKPGHRVSFPGFAGVSAWIEEVLPGPGMRRLRWEGVDNVYDFMDRAGHVPLPPYINRGDEELDRERYQTVFAEIRGSVAAPTAGLHFTPEILAELGRKGVNVHYILLHVGLGTFRPVYSADIRQHRMHAEHFELAPATAAALNQCRASGGRVFAVGSTTARTLETACGQTGIFTARQGQTDCFIYPGYRFRGVDAFISNFHLPGSSLVMLVAAFAGYDNIMKAYHHAINEGYRFFSYGDAMLMLPGED